MKSVFIVQGSSGSYSDAREWSVRAFESKEEAEVFAKAAVPEWTEEHAELERLQDTVTSFRYKVWRTLGWDRNSPLTEALMAAVEADSDVIASQRAIEVFKLTMVDPYESRELPEYHVDEIPFDQPRLPTL